MIDATTHYEGCWQSGAKHYECAVRELAACSAQFDRQQEMLDRNAEQNAALRLDAERYAYLVGGCRFAETDACWGTKESLDAAIDAAKEEGK